MAFNTTARAGRWVYLVQITLSGQTLYYANVPCIVDDQPYQPRLRSAPTISTQLTELLNPKQIASSINLRLANEDQALTTLLRGNTWGNRTVKIYIGGDTSISGGSSDLSLASDFSQIFEGRIRFPNGTRWDEESATITVNDRRVQDAKDLPIKSSANSNTPRYVTGEYPTLDVQFNTDPKPILIGDWTTSAESERVRPVCVNTTTRKFKLAFHAIGTIEKVYKQQGLTAFTSVSFSSVSLADASFILDVAYDPDKDVVTCHCSGAMDGATLIENPSKVLQYLLKTHLGVATSNINSTAFDTLETDIDFKMRRHVVEVIDSQSLMYELGRDVGAEIYIKEGQYHVQKTRPSASLSGLSTFDVTDLVAGSLDAIADPDNNYFNAASIDYKFNPETGRYKTVDDESASSIADVGATINRKFQFNWLYRDADATDRLGDLLFVFGQEPTTVSLTLRNRAMLHYIADKLYLDYRNERDGVTYFNNVPFQVRGITVNPEAMEITMRLWDISRLVAFGKWALDSVTSWANADEATKDANGWWTHDDGNIVLGDVSTARSLWGADS